MEDESKKEKRKEKTSGNGKGKRENSTKIKEVRFNLGDLSLDEIKRDGIILKRRLKQNRSKLMLEFKKAKKKHTKFVEL